MIEDVLTNIEDPEEVPEENHVSDSDHIENETIEEVSEPDMPERWQKICEGICVDYNSLETYDNSLLG